MDSTNTSRDSQIFYRMVILSGVIFFVLAYAMTYAKDNKFVIDIMKDIANSSVPVSDY